jgi:hypothetical protein
MQSAIANKQLLNARLLSPVPATFFIPDLPIHFINDDKFLFAPLGHCRNVSAHYSFAGLRLETLP